MHLSKGEVDSCSQMGLWVLQDDELMPLGVHTARPLISGACRRWGGVGLAEPWTLIPWQPPCNLDKELSRSPVSRSAKRG